MPIRAVPHGGHFGVGHAVAADEAAKLLVAEKRAREQMKFQLRALEASRRATERGLQILKQSAKGSKPSDAARLLAVGDMIGRAALGLGGSDQTAAFGLRQLFERAHEVLRVSTSRNRPSDSARMFLVAAELGNQALGIASGASTGGAFGLNPIAPPNIKVVLHEDAQSRERRKHEAAFLAAHPEIKRPNILTLLDATIIDEHGVARNANDNWGPVHGRANC